MEEAVGLLLLGGVVSLCYAFSWGKDNRLNRPEGGCSLLLGTAMIGAAAYVFLTRLAPWR